MRYVTGFILLLQYLTCLGAASSLESVLVPMLGPRQCTMVFLSLDFGIVKNLTQQMEMIELSSKPMMIYDDASIADAKKISSTSKCLIGFSDIKALDSLQIMLLPTFYRQLVGLAPIGINLLSTNVSITLNKKHHPVLLLSKNEDIVKQSLVCDQQVVDINMMRGSGWIRKPIFERLAFERLCNQGQHPLKDKSLVVSSYALPPYLHMSADLKIEGGVTYDMVNMIANQYGFSISFLPYSNWFIFYANGTIDGSIAPVLFGQADLSLEQTTQHAYTLGSMTVTTYTQVVPYIERAPKPISQMWNISYSLDNATWLFLWITCLVVIVVLQLTINLEKVKNRVRNAKHDTTSLYDTIEATLAILFQEFRTKKNSYTDRGLSKVVCFMWVTASMFVVMAFSGNLKSSFVRQNYEHRTMTLNEMVDKDMPIYTSTEVAEFFEATQDISPLHGRILCQARKKKSIIKTGPDYMSTVINGVVNMGGSFAINTHTLEFTRGEYLRAGSDLPLVAIPERFMVLSMGMFFQSHDPRVEYFDLMIGWMTDSGIIDGLFRKHLPFAGLKYQEGMEEHPLILEHFAISLFTALGGLLIAALYFAAEMSKMSTAKVRKVHLM